MLKYLIVKKKSPEGKKKPIKKLFLLFQKTKVKKSKQDTIKKKKAFDLKKWNKPTNVEEFQLLQM